MIIGDPTIGVGLTVILYFLAATSCFITARELDCLRLCAIGKTASEIGEALEPCRYLGQARYRRSERREPLCKRGSVFGGIEVGCQCVTRLEDDPEEVCGLVGHSIAQMAQAASFQSSMPY